MKKKKYSHRKTIFGAVLSAAAAVLIYAACLAGTVYINVRSAGFGQSEFEKAMRVVMGTDSTPVSDKLVLGTDYTEEI